MRREAEQIVAVCGLICNECDVYRAPSEPHTMKKLLEWLKKKMPEKARPDLIRCGGCLGEPENHWSGDCDILRCAVDRKSVTSCSMCDEFVCERLTKWAAGSKRYSEALERLRSMRSR